MVASPLCDRCSEPICDSEEAVSTASKRFFHRSCFVCSKRQCGKLLSLGEYGVYQNQIFCPHCFLLILQPIENDNGNVNGKTATNGQHAHEVNGQHSPIRCRSYEHQLRTLQLHDDDGVEESVEDDDSVKSVEEHPIILVKLEESQRKRTTPFGASPIPEADELESLHSQPSPNPLPSIRSPTWRITSTDGKLATIIPFRPSNCKRCGSRVYEAEKVVAASEVWHKGCFRCLRCGRSLEPGKFSDRASEIYCNCCYAKEFGPKGVGCGIGSRILQMHQ